MIKLIDYKDFEKDEIYISKSSICSMKRKRNDGLTTANIIGYGECYFSETPEEILAMPDIETTEKVVDWKQRRYELTRDFMSAMISSKGKIDFVDYTDIFSLVNIVEKNLVQNENNEN